jgi:ribonucleoside-diphosphate reductase alpha chain
VRLRRVAAAADPDAAAIPVILPAAWDDQAASALAALCAPAPKADLIDAASGWIDPIAATAGDPAMAGRLHALLRSRRGAPSAGIWRHEPEPMPGFTLNLAAFFAPETGFDHAAFAEAIDLAVAALTIAAPRADALLVGIADLALLLARLGLDYDSDEARRTGADLAAFLTARAKAAASSRHRRLTGLSPAGAVEALLGIETTGIAAPIAPVDSEMRLARWARARLITQSMTAEQALAEAVSGGDPFGMPPPAAMRAMHEAVAPHLHSMPERAGIMVPFSAPKPREALPARRAGYTQKASVGGHRLFVRTGDYADGRLGELAVSLPKDTAAFRGLMDAFTAAISIGLQHGVPLDEFIETFTGTRFGPAGAVEGDPAVSHATSLLDYVFRHLAANYANEVNLAPAEPDAEERHDNADLLPFLPLELPRNPPHAAPSPRRPVLKLVG